MTLDPNICNLCRSAVSALTRGVGRRRRRMWRCQIVGDRPDPSSRVVAFTAISLAERAFKYLPQIDCGREWMPVRSRE